MTSFVDDRLRKDWSHHTIRQLAGCTGDFQAFMLERPGHGRMGSCLVMFTPEGIVICGDWCPESNKGAVSNYGYGISWFASHLGEDYLCSKFLDQVYRRDKAHWYVADRVKDLEADDEDRSERREDLLHILKDALECDDGTDIDGEHFGTEERFAELMTEADDYDALTDGVARGYDLREAALLCVIQQRFAQLYQQLTERKTCNATCEDWRSCSRASDPGVRCQAHVER